MFGSRGVASSPAFPFSGKYYTNSWVVSEKASIARHKHTVVALRCIQSPIYLTPNFLSSRSVEKHRGVISAILTNDKSTPSMIEENVENLGVVGLDPGLEPFKGHFKYQMKRYLEQKSLIEKHEGGLEEFSKGYIKFGFNREQDGILYREWAPAAREAQLIGDFNGWDGSNHAMEKNQFGVWSIKVPDCNGKPIIPHNSRVKFRFKHGNGVWVDRIPAWIRYATVEPSSFGAAYDGVYWEPPTSESLLLLLICRSFCSSRSRTNLPNCPD